MRYFVHLVFGLILVVGLRSWGQENDSNRPHTEQELLELVQLEPENAVHYFNLAVHYHQNRKYRSALTNYSKVIKLNSSLSPIAYYYMARIFKINGEIEKAQKAVNKINIKEVPVNLRKRVLLFKNDLYIAVVPAEPEIKEESPATQEAPEERKLSTYWDISGGTNDNPAYASSFSQNDTQWSGKLYLGYQLWAGPTHEIKTNYAFNATSYGDNSDSNTTYHDLTLPMAYYFDDHRIRLIPEYILDTYGGETYSYSYGASTDFTQKVDNYYGTLYYQYLKMDVADEDNSYLNGQVHKLKFSVKKRSQASDLTLGLAYNSYNYDDTDSVTSSYNAPSIDLTLGYYVGSWDFSLYTVFEKRFYATDSDDFDRKDSRTLSSLTAGWTFRPWLRTYMSATYSNNTSNDGENEYHQTVFSLGVSGGY